MSIKQETIKAEVDKLRDYLSSKTWCDCEISEAHRDLVIQGWTSFDQNPDILLTFKEFTFASVKREWQFDFNTQIISLIKNEESILLNQTYEIEEGNYVFKIYAEDISKPFFIIANDFIAKQII